jgi:hypothetical protein
MADSDFKSLTAVWARLDGCGRARVLERAQYLIEMQLQEDGNDLLGRLLSRAKELGHSRSQMAKRLGVTTTYIAHLVSGARETENMCEAVRESCAQYLGAPVATVLLAAAQGARPHQPSLRLVVDNTQQEVQT